MNVAVPSTVTLMVADDLLVEGKEKEVECLVTSPGNPAPLVSLQLYTASSILHLKNGTGSLKYNWVPEERDSGARLACCWQQFGPGQQILYQGKEDSRELEVLLEPYIVDELSNTLVYKENTTLIINFISKPLPIPEDIKWSIVEKGNESTIVKTDLKQLLNRKKFLFESSAMIGSLSTNSTLKFSVRNKVGESERNFTLFVFSNDAQETNLAYILTSWG